MNLNSRVILCNAFGQHQRKNICTYNKGKKLKILIFGNRISLHRETNFKNRIMGISISRKFNPIMVSEKRQAVCIKTLMFYLIFLVSDSFRNGCTGKPRKIEDKLRAAFCA